MAERAVAALGGRSDLRVVGPAPAPGRSAVTPAPDTPITLPAYELGAKVATRKAYGDALAALAARPEVVALDGEVSNSTYAEEFKAVAPDRFFEMFIAEQQLIGAAIGLSVRGYVSFASTFAAFLSRAYDFIRLWGLPGRPTPVGTHAGVEIGADGPSQMALEDLASSGPSTARCCCTPPTPPRPPPSWRPWPTAGTVYLRTTRGAYPVLYEAGEEFPVGGSKVLRSGDGDRVSLVGAGVTLHQCLEAAARLETTGSRRG